MAPSGLIITTSAMSHLVLVELMIASSQAAKAVRYDNQSAPNGVWSDLADIHDPMV